MNKILLLLTALPVFPLTARAAVTQTFDFTGLNLAVPDGNPGGLANAQTVTSTIIISVTSVTISLNIAGTFNGDLYAYVTNGSGFAVLLNRPGWDPALPAGYNDDGLAVTFADSAANEIHTYRDIATPGTSVQLIGFWQPDGRNVDPDSVGIPSPRTAMLSSFAGAAASSGWTLFVADVSGDDTHTLQSWNLSITGEVPEPPAAGLSALGLLAGLRRRR